MAEESFEALFAALEEKSRRLEQGNLGLEESLRLYEEGAGLVEKLRTILASAELRIRTVQARVAEDRAELREVEVEYGLGDEELDDGYEA